MRRRESQLPRKTGSRRSRPIESVPGKRGPSYRGPEPQEAYTSGLAAPDHLWGRSSPFTSACHRREEKKRPERFGVLADLLLGASQFLKFGTVNRCPDHGFPDRDEPGQSCLWIDGEQKRLAPGLVLEDQKCLNLAQIQPNVERALPPRYAIASCPKYHVTRHSFAPGPSAREDRSPRLLNARLPFLAGLPPSPTVNR